MIDKIIVKNTASYQNDAGQMLAPKEVNFVFGLNGSGKTTISRLIASPSSEKFSDCHISWKGSPLKCSVYNQDFVKKNFSETVPGIFTLGESAIETKNKINDLTTEIENLRKTIDQKNKEIDDSEDENSYRPRLRKLEEIYTNKFWQIKKKLDEENSCILRAITGVLGSKERFKEKLLLENATNKADLLDQDQLESLSTHLLVSSVEKKELIPIPNCEELLAIEGDDIFKTAIVGKENVAISELLHKLGNSSWFSQGIQYLDFSEGLCPFCQQKLPDNFNQQIEDYFDKTYENNIKKISLLKEQYVSCAEQLVAQIQKLIDTANDFLNVDSLRQEFVLLKTMFQLNTEKLKKKIMFPSNIIVLDSIREIFQQIVIIIQNANETIKEHNLRVDNIKNERITLASQVWKFIITKLSSDLHSYSEQKEKIQQAIEKTQFERDEILKIYNEKKIVLSKAEKSLTSVVPIADEINSILDGFGFTSFKLRVDNANKTYHFVRSSGESAFESLSEGERNFITFLYFLYTLKGNTADTSFNENKVLVIDDPVSSLDQDVLFLVSSLIRDLFRDIYSGNGHIRQIFIFSHNLYFFKEVSYEKWLRPKQTGYWMIKKNNNISKILHYEKNPVSSTYEMLWDEVIRAQENPSGFNTVTLANAMRRIIEYYFSFLGGEDINQFHTKFPDGDRQVFKALVSWTNSGSHSSFDDFSAATALYDSEKFLCVFKNLFLETNHISHYNMMMKINEKI